MSKSFNKLLFFRNPSAIDLLNSAIDKIRSKNILSACSLFEKLEKEPSNFEKELGAEIVDFKKLIVVIKMVPKSTYAKEKERFHILDLLDKIMISLNEIPWEKITLPIFKYWCDLFRFENMLHGIIIDDNPSKKIMNVVKSVDLKVHRFFFRGLIYFKMNIQIVDANINAQKSESLDVYFKENFLIPIIERIKNCETIQELIDSSPTAECPVCMDVTFTESTEFVIRFGCDHLVCFSCHIQLTKSNYRLVNKYIIFLSFD